LAGRPRINTRTKQAFYPQRSRDFKLALGIIGKATMHGQQPLIGKLKITIGLYKNCKTDSIGYGDVDNHQKAIFDALNKICFADDCQIVEVVCNKHKDKFERIEIEIEEVKDYRKPYIFEFMDEVKKLNPDLPKYLQVGDKILIQYRERE